MRLTVPLNPESHAYWTALATPHAAGTRPATITLPWDPRRYVVAGLTASHHVDPDLATLDVRLVLFAPLAPR